jgi:hypothetical protein
MFPTEVNADNVTIVLFVKLARVLPSLPQPCGWLGRVAIGAQTWLWLWLRTCGHGCADVAMTMEAAAQTCRANSHGQDDVA